MDVAIDPTDPTRLAVATNMMPTADVQRASGVWVSGDAGKTWTQQNADLPMTRGGAVAFDPFDPTRLVFGSFGRGFFITTWESKDRPMGGVASVSTPTDRTLSAVDETDGKPRPIHLRNGDMTDGTTVPTGWETRWGDVAASRDTEIFHSAPASLVSRRQNPPAGSSPNNSTSPAEPPCTSPDGFDRPGKGKRTSLSKVMTAIGKRSNSSR